VVCVKIVPKPEEIRVDPQTRLLKRSNVRAEINPPDMNALEMALELKDVHGARISILSMGPASFEPHLRVALAMGADHIYLLSDQAFAGADTLATTFTLSQGIRKIGPVDLIFCGEESSDGATGQVPPGLAEWLGIGQLTLLTKVSIDQDRNTARGRREISGGYEILEIPLPGVISVKTASNEPRFMDYGIKSWAFERDRLTVWNADDLGADVGFMGLAGSPTIVTELAEAPYRERRREFLDGSPEDVTQELIKVIQRHM
jgi:electron transfer flavoprotein beta subunit